MSLNRVITKFSNHPIFIIIHRKNDSYSISNCKEI